jgi:peptidoglycan/LPS O-acetylase OafA/YrhL
MRQEIQGLRAVAVLLVVLFHLWPDRLPGGYIGVDVFFVISGYLITSHILREVDRTGSVSLTGFWARRLRRLLPASYVVLVVSAVGVLVFVPRLVWQQFFGEMLAAALYVENWTLAINSVDYLAADNTPSPAQHYWTLSAEEQFYLLWPVLVLLGLWLATRGSARLGNQKAVVFGVLAATTAASLGYSLWVTATDPALAYFVTPARAWEFGAGALLAFAPAAARLLGARTRAGLGWLALVGLLSCSLVFDEATPMPGTAALWVVAASMTLIWVEAPGVSWASSNLLVLRPARLLGDISYAVYLWHWPLIILLPYVTDHPLTNLDKLSVLLATIGASALTKRWVEDPVRAARRFGLARPLVTFAYAAAGAVVLTALCVVPRVDVARDAERNRQAAASLVAEAPPCFGAAARDPQATHCPNPALADVLVPTPAAVEKDFPQYQRCNAPALADPLQPCRFGQRRSDLPHIAVIGDSHARIMMTMVEPTVDAGQITADLFVSGGCPWSTYQPNLKIPEGRTCADFRERLSIFLDRHAKDYDAVLTTARLTTMRGSREERAAGLAEAWNQVTRQGVPVVVLRDNPQDMADQDPERDPNFCLSEVSLSEANERCGLDRSEKLDRWYDALSAAARRTPGAELVDLTDFYCDEDKCPVVIGGVNVYYDNNHLTVTYAKTLAPYLYRELTKHGILSRPMSETMRP